MRTKHQNKIFPLENFTHHFININRRRLSPSLRALNFLPVLPCTILVPSQLLPTRGEGILKAPPYFSETRPFSYRAHDYCSRTTMSCLPGHDFFLHFQSWFRWEKNGQDRPPQQLTGGPTKLRVKHRSGSQNNVRLRACHCIQQGMQGIIACTKGFPKKHYKEIYG